MAIKVKYPPIREIDAVIAVRPPWGLSLLGCELKRGIRELNPIDIALIAHSVLRAQNKGLVAPIPSVEPGVGHMHPADRAVRIVQRRQDGPDRDPCEQQHEQGDHRARQRLAQEADPARPPAPRIERSAGRTGRASRIGLGI